jgi:hypothetical protein
MARDASRPHSHTAARLQQPLSTISFFLAVPQSCTPSDRGASRSRLLGVARDGPLAERL